MTVLIGTSGWSYGHWEPELYPPGLPARDRLARYAAEFGTAELNSSFYRWPPPSSFASWRRRLPRSWSSCRRVSLATTRAWITSWAWSRRGSGWPSNSGTRAGTTTTCWPGWKPTAPPTA